MSIDRRSVLLGLGSAAALSACGGPNSAVYQVIDSYRALDRAKKEYAFPRSEIDGQPLGVLGVQVEGGLKGLMVWTKRENGFDHWRSGNGIVLVTQSGRIIRSGGFEQDQLASRLVAGVDPWGLPLDPSRRYELRREIDYLPDQYGVEALYQLDYDKPVTQTLMKNDAPRRLSQWNETVRTARSRRTWKQLLQVDPMTGDVVRSIQHLGPRRRVILELLKPPTVI